MGRGRRFAFAPKARRDLMAILQESGRLFGPLQQERYATLIRAAIERVRDDPRCIGSKAREDILPRLRSLHLNLAARRHGAAAHILYYEERTTPEGAAIVVILRILHDRMDPELHIAGDLD